MLFLMLPPSWVRRIDRAPTMVRFHSVITFFVVCYESKRCNDYVPRDDGSGGGVWRVADGSLHCQNA